MRRILAFLLYAALATNAWATSQPISVLPSASALSGSELSYCVQGAGDAKCLASQYATYVLGTYVPGFPPDDNWRNLWRDTVFQREYNANKF